MSVWKRACGAASSESSKSAAFQRAPWLRRARNAVAGLLGLSLVAATPSAAGQTSVPSHWIAYAQLASGQLQGWLADETNESALRLQEWGQKYLERSGTGEVAHHIVVRLWVGTSGQVERAEFTSLNDAQADADLRRVLTAQPISEPPPKDLRQPIT
ncbi:MAG TPA: hypothetical protein DIU11_10450, partial [Pusillimonas sp.]|nr:hypothetical protein [Pusillimonas sp.]